jgi:hypothetical protein
MPLYEINMTVEFSGTIEADSEAHAEDLAYTGWGETMDALVPYFGVDQISVEELPEEEEEEEEEAE